MKREAALELLPEAYGTALRLRDQGLDETDIAETLGVPPEAVGPLLTLADAKLDQLLSSRKQSRLRSRGGSFPVRRRCR